MAFRHRLPVYLVFTDTPAKDAAASLRAATVVETPLWDIDVGQKPGALLEARITNKANSPLDAVVSVSCQPEVTVTPVRRFVLDVPPGGTRVLAFRCEAGAARPASATVIVESGSFRMRETKETKNVKREE